MFSGSRLDARIVTPGAACQQLPREFGARVHNVLAIVEHEQEAPVARELEQCLEHRMPRVFLHAERGGHRLRHQPGIADRREFDQPHAVRIIVEHLCRHLQRQARLAEASAAQQRQEPRLAEQPGDFGEFALARDERRQLLRQVVRRLRERPQGRKLSLQRRMHDLAAPARAGPGRAAGPAPGRAAKCPAAAGRRPARRRPATRGSGRRARRSSRAPRD